MTASDRSEYKQHKSLAAYIDRISAEQLNFRKFIIREWTERDNGKRYYHEKAWIQLAADGEVKCSDPTYAPTDDERAELKMEAKNWKWPKPVYATFALAEQQRGKLKVKREDWYVCLDRTRKKVLWCQMRREKETGDKDYYPWIFWDDGEWRAMETDGPLPFWKPAKRRETGAIMIHEGAKAASYVDWLVNSLDLEARKLRAEHPWFDTLQYYEHWGMMGGALSPHRADYDEVRAEKPYEVVYVCDRDDPGEAALQKVSRIFRGSLVGLKFDTRWPAGWDLADQMPEEFFQTDLDGVLQYTGPALNDLTVPATWATDMVVVDKKSVAVLRPEFKEEWVHVVSPEAFINKRKPSRVYYKATEFNNRVRPYSEARDTAEELKKDDKGKVETLTYSPALPPGIVAGTPRAFNTHQPSAIKAMAGNAQPFLDYLDYLLPIESDRTELLRWMATLVACPEIKMSYGILLVSETQGIGKSTLAEKILWPLIGKDNVSFPSDAEISEGQFNGWKAHKRLAVINEIYQGNSPKVYNRLKDLITDQNIRVNEKFVTAYNVANWCHVLACSNSMRALKLPDDDRRWFVPRVTEVLQPHSYWAELNRWLATVGLPIIYQFCLDFVEKHGSVLCGAHAPDSSAKRKMVEEGYSPGQSLVANWLDCMKACADATCPCDRENGECQAGRPKDERQRPVVVTDKALVEMIKVGIYEGRQSDRLERDRTIRKLAAARGWHLGEEPKFVAPGRKATVIATEAELAEKTPATLRKENWRIIDAPPF